MPLSNTLELSRIRIDKLRKEGVKCKPFSERMVTISAKDTLSAAQFAQTIFSWNDFDNVGMSES